MGSYFKNMRIYQCFVTHIWQRIGRNIMMNENSEFSTAHGMYFKHTFKLRLLVNGESEFC